MKDLARLVKLMAPHWKSMLLATLAGFFTVASGVGLMGASAFLIAGAALHPPVLELTQAIVGVRFFGLSRAVFRYLERYFSHDATFRLLSHLRVWFYRALEPLAPARLLEYRSGDLVSRMAADVETLEQFYLRVLAPPLVALLVLLGVFAFLARFGLSLAFAFLFFFLAASVAAPLAVRALGRGKAGLMVETRAALNAEMVDTIQGMTEIAAFNRSARQQQQVRELSAKFLGLQEQTAGIRSMSTALAGLLMHLAMWTVLLLAIPLVTRGKLDGIYLAMLALVTLGGFEAVLPLPMIFQHVEESLAAARRLFAVTDAKTEIPAPGAPSPLPRDYELRVKGLCFRYAPADPPALDGLEFVLPQGGRLAIVGPSGAGKSTLVNLLLRFWDYPEGSITLGGQELKAFSPEDLRGHISVVAQSTYLFNASVRENLLLAKPGAGEEELLRAAREAQIHHFIQGLPGDTTPLWGKKALNYPEASGSAWPSPGRC